MAKQMRKFMILFLNLLIACNVNNENEEIDVNTLKITENIIVSSYIGNGPQWGGYDMIPYWLGSPTLSDEDWNTVFERVSFMRPGMVRIMVSQGWNYIDGTEFNPSKSDAILGKILDYCQKNGITVQLGEWGHVGGSAVDQKWVENAVSFLSYLVKDKGYTCIRYYTLVNEPNGNWSSTKGDYNIWERIISAFAKKMEEKGLLDYVEIMGPDISIRDTNNVSWIIRAKKNLYNEVQAYDIHIYPDNMAVYTGSFSKLLATYKAASDRSRDMVIGELGFKYDSNSILGKENQFRIRNCQYAAEDSQMMVYDSFYGIDMVDATIQAMSEGYSGVIYWMLDDAMYNETGMSSSMRLKKWGFWNILGEEKFNDTSDENLRPWFYPISLMCRYFPSGMNIMEVVLPVPTLQGLRATFGIKDGKCTLAIVNNSNNDYEFTLKADNITDVDKLNFYKYSSKEGCEYDGATDTHGFPIPESKDVKFEKLSDSGFDISIPAKTFILYTNLK